MIATGADVAIPVLVSRFIDQELVPHRMKAEDLIRFGTEVIILQVMAAAFQYYSTFAFQKIAQLVVRRLRSETFAKLQELALSYFDRTPDGALVSRITNDTEAVKELFVNVLSSYLQNLIFLVGVLVAMFQLDTGLAFWFLLFLPAVWLLMWGYRRLSSEVYRRMRHKLGQMNAMLNEALQGMNMIQVMRQEERLKLEFAALNDEHYRIWLKSVKLYGLMLRPATQFLAVVAVVTVLDYFGWKSLSGSVSVGVLFGFVNLIDRVFEPINQMMMRLSQLQQAVASAERVFELLDEEEYAPRKQGEGHPRIREGRIEFKNVSFSYDGKTQVLKNISFTVEPGQTVALVGHTGSGKSSIINLLMRFYPLSSGEITIDGQPLERFDDRELREGIGLVLQDPFLFAGDIKSNIRLHRQEITDARIREAARLVQADSFIASLPRGYDEPVVERGATLSSGQRQLISFARTIASDPKILLLDEATAHIDTETEEAIQEALNRMRKGRTTIAIAHRLSTVQDADLILVLHKGEIVERGTHQELLARKGLYHKMFLLQQGAAKPEQTMV
jgi:ATP-binding cassette subfamily B protein